MASWNFSRMARLLDLTQCIPSFAQNILVVERATFVRGWTHIYGMTGIQIYFRYNEVHFSAWDWICSAPESQGQHETLYEPG